MTQIVEGGTAEPRTLNPILASDPLSDQLSRLVFDGLVTVDPSNGKPSADLASSWDVSDDRKTYTFHLRDGVRWSDGQAFSASDVVFTYHLMMDGQAHSPRYSRLVERIQDVGSKGSDTVVVTLIAPDASFLATLATLAIVPEHVLSAVPPQEMVSDPFGIASTVGTGPFTLQHWARGEQLVFSRNVSSFRPPVVDQYVYRVVASPQDLLNALHDGSVDWGPIDPGLIDKAKGDDKVRVLSMPGLGLEAVALQLDSSKSSLLLDAGVRKALMLALDRNQLVSNVWHGAAQVADGTIPPGSWAAAPSKTTYTQNLDEARKLLQDAGWVAGDDGVRSKGSVRLSLRLTTNGDDPQHQQTVNWLVNSWRAIGVEAVPDFQQASSVRQIITQSRDFQAMLVGYNDDLDPDQAQFWASDSSVDGLNIGRYVNPDVDNLLVDALRASDPQKRADDYHQMQDLLMTDLPVLPLVFPQETIGLSQRMRDVPLNPISIRDRAGVERWAPAF